MLHMYFRKLHTLVHYKEYFTKFTDLRSRQMAIVRELMNFSACVVRSKLITRENFSGQLQICYVFIVVFFQL